ncbi:MAG TPA: cation diffusion facilitator family transporter [Mycobacteriales bacterium]
MTADETPFPDAESSESLTTVLVATAANLVIACAKLAAGMVSGSSAMLSEAAHSFADTVTEILLLVAIRRGERPADDTHPFGYGRETYVWALLAAVATFVAGAGFSITEGLHTMVHGGPSEGHFTLNYLVLAVAFVLEAISLRTAVRQVREKAAELRTAPTRYFRLTSDTTVKAVLLEDSAALVGIAFAAVGLLLQQVTGAAVWDGLASVLIGVLLAVVAFVLGHANLALLIGRSVPFAVRERARDVVAALPHVEAVSEILAVYLGPARMLIVAHVDFTDTATAADVEHVSAQVEHRLREVFPGARYVVVDPTDAGERHEPA